MPYSKEFCNNEKTIIKFSFIEPFTRNDFEIVLGYLTALLKMKKHFTFFVDTTNANRPPIDCTITLLSWLKNNRSDLKKGFLLGSTILMNKENSGIISDILTSAFKIYPTVAPNKITTDRNEALNFVQTLCEAHKQIK